MKSSEIAFEAVTPLGFDAAVERCRAELAREGFGVLSEIDIAAKLHEKLGVDVPPNRILGACHPSSAHRALTAVPAIAVLLPCNVTIAVEDRGTVIRAMNPESAMQMFDDPEIAAVARQVGAALRRVVERSAA